MLDFIRWIVGLRSSSLRLLAGLLISVGVLGSIVSYLFLENRYLIINASAKIEKERAESKAEIEKLRVVIDTLRSQNSSLRVEIQVQKVVAVQKLYEDQKAFNDPQRAASLKETAKQKRLAEQQQKYILNIKTRTDELTNKLQQ